MRFKTGGLILAAICVAALNDPASGAVVLYTFTDGVSPSAPTIDASVPAGFDASGFASANGGEFFYAPNFGSLEGNVFVLSNWSANPARFTIDVPETHSFVVEEVHFILGRTGGSGEVFFRFDINGEEAFRFKTSISAPFSTVAPGSAVEHRLPEGSRAVPFELVHLSGPTGVIYLDNVQVLGRFEPSATPEPGTAALLVIGAGVVTSRLVRGSRGRSMGRRGG